MVIVALLGLFVLICLSLPGSFECSFEHARISVKSVEVVDLFDDVTL